MVQMKISPSGEEAAKKNERSFFKEVEGTLKDFDEDFTKETGLSKAQRFGVAAGATIVGATLYQAGWGVDVGMVSFLGAGIGGLGAMGVVYHAKDARLTRAFVAGVKAFNHEMKPLKDKVTGFYATAKQHIVTATRKDPTFIVNDQVISQDKRSMPRRIFDYVKAMKTK